MILVSLCIAFLLGQKLIVLIAFWSKFNEVADLSDDELPTVSVLIPARNEARNLPACLDALLKLDYPTDKLEILVGNDASDDATAGIAASYGVQHPYVRLVDIKAEYHGLVARSNVLAQLAKKSEGAYLVFLDADMEVTAGWLRSMVAPTARGHELVSGYTEVKAKGWLSRFQQIDWLNVIMLLKAGADMGLPGTALGNNMLVSRRAYESVGGYEVIGPTFTEDNDLTLALVKRGTKLFQVANEHKACTLPLTSLKALYIQRHRWLKGAFKQPLLRLLPLLFSRVFMLWFGMLSFWDFKWAAGLLMIMAFWEMIMSITMSQKTKTLVWLYIAFVAPVFNSLLDTFTLLSYPWHRKVVWKGRKL